MHVFYVNTHVAQCLGSSAPLRPHLQTVTKCWILSKDIAIHNETCRLLSMVANVKSVGLERTSKLHAILRRHKRERFLPFPLHCQRRLLHCKPRIFVSHQPRSGGGVEGRPCREAVPLCLDDQSGGAFPGSSVRHTDNVGNFNGVRFDLQVNAVALLAPALCTTLPANQLPSHPILTSRSLSITPPD